MADRPLCIKAGLIARGLQFGDERRL